MSRTRTALVLSATAGLVALGGVASAAPTCEGPVVGAVHTAHEAVEGAPVGGRVVGAAVHGAEAVACRLPR